MIFEPRMMDDCIIISDDEDVEFLEVLINIEPKEPVIIDLTKIRNRKSNNSTQQEEHGDNNLHNQSNLEDNTNEPTNQDCDVEDHQVPTNGTEDQTMPECDPMSSSSSGSNQNESNNFYNDNDDNNESIPSEPKSTNEENIPQQATFDIDAENQPQVSQSSDSRKSPVQKEEPQAKSDKDNIKLDEPQVQVEKKRRTALDDKQLMLDQKELGNVKYRNNLFNDAIKVYKRANELAVQLGDMDTSAKLHFNLAMTYYKLNSYNQAIDECIEAVKIDDNYLKAHVKRAEIYIRQRKFDEAVICYEHICEISKDPGFAMLLHKAKEEARRAENKDSYQILGINSPFITNDTLKKAYRQQALRHHPDRHSGADSVTRKIEEKKFKDASEAFKNLQIKLGYSR